MAGNIADKARYALQGYDVRRGSGCDWYVSGATGQEEKFISCVYDRWGANSPTKVGRILKEQALASGMQPKSYIAPPSPLEKFEGELHTNPIDYREAKEVYEMEKGVEKAAGLDRAKIKTISKVPLILVAIAIGVLIYWLGMRK